MTGNVTNKDAAEAGLKAITDAALAEVLAAGENGLRNDEVARALGLETSVNGGQRNHLTYAILNQLVAARQLERRKEGRHVFYSGGIAT